MTNDPEATLVAIGQVGRAHGREGAFVVERPSEHSGRFDVGAELYVDGSPARVVSSKRSGGRLVVQLDVAARRGARLELVRSELPGLAADTYYVFDLVGLEVITDEGTSLGKIIDVLPLPANDVIELESGELLPLVKACVLEVDVSAGRVVVARSFAAGG
ncbi:MAG: ribosome maturation factor RimM [Gaiellaceae bacterium]